MLRRILITLIGLAVTVGVISASPASASVPCNGGSSCDQTVITHNTAAQFILNVFNCISTTNHDLDGITVFNNSSDHARHSYVVQARREEPTNISLEEHTVFANYGESVPVQFSIISVPKSQKLYGYVRDGNGFIQRLSVYHLEGGSPWTVGNSLVYPYGTYACI